MIYIANPIYDAVFKYLMEDEEVAKRFIGIIISKKITQITLLPQEKTITHDDLPIRVQRLDFIAHVTEENGEMSKVLIELQKSNRFYHADVMRFRGYLAKQYMVDDLPIITIYLLGFVLDERFPASIKVGRQAVDLSTQKTIDYKNEFIEKLTHDCYVIQIPLLKKPLRTKIDYVLSIFDQSLVISKDKEGRKVLVYPLQVEDEDIQKIIKRLESANGNEQLREKIEDEEYLEKAYQESLGKLDKKVLLLEKIAEEERQKAEQTKKELDEEKERVEQTKKELDEEKQRAEQTKKELDEEKKRAEQTKKELDEEKQRAEQEKQRAEQEKQRVLKAIEKMRMLGASDVEIEETLGIKLKDYL